MKKALTVLLVAAVFAVNVVLCILLHGLFFCPYENPLSDFGSGKVLDHQTLSDSTLLLVRDGDVVTVMEFQRNPLLPRYALQESHTVAADETEFITAAQTLHALYPYTVRDHQDIALEGTVDTSLQWGIFCRTYGLPAFVLLLVEYALFTLLRKKKKAE